MLFRSLFPIFWLAFKMLASLSYLMIARKKSTIFRYTIFLHFSKCVPLVLSKQCVHALYPLFDCPEMLLSAGQSLMVTNNNARRSNSLCSCSSHTRTPGLCHSCQSSSTSGLSYTSMSLPGCLGPWMGTGIIMNFRFTRWRKQFSNTCIKFEF